MTEEIIWKQLIDSLALLVMNEMNWIFVLWLPPHHCQQSHAELSAESWKEDKR